MRVLVDTSALLALCTRRDQYHTRAVKLARRHMAEGGTYLGTVAILGELYSHLLYLKGPANASAILAQLLDDPIYDWKEVSVSLVHEAQARWLARFSEQSFSLVDAVSFELMRRERVNRAFAFDKHFEVAGYEVCEP